jgi:hypothetical protein
MNFLPNKSEWSFTITELEVWAVSKKPYCINDLMPLAAHLKLETFSLSDSKIK